MKVTIAITTYNLEAYIAEALDGVLMQKTNFDYEIVVADDASTDGTISILKQYQEKYPERIKLLLADVNQGSLPNSNRIFSNLKSEYFSFLDGDDVWLDENRLQKQVDFLDEHPEYSMCAGNTRYLKDGKVAEFLVSKACYGKSYTFEDMLADKMPFFHTSAILVRNTIFMKELPKCYVRAEKTFENCALRGEDFRRVLHLQTGPLYVMDGLFSYYRIHEKGLWQGSSQLKRQLETAICFHFYSKFFGEKCKQFRVKAEESYEAYLKALFLEVLTRKTSRLQDKESEMFCGLMRDRARRGLLNTPKQKQIITFLKIVNAYKIS